jgi:hypothetical protein
MERSFNRCGLIFVIAARRRRWTAGGLAARGRARAAGPFLVVGKLVLVVKMGILVLFALAGGRLPGRFRGVTHECTT